MKKIYKKPNVAIESFVSEEVMVSKTNMLSGLAVSDGEGNTFNFLEATGEGNILNSIDYQEWSSYDANH